MMRAIDRLRGNVKTWLLIIGVVAVVCIGGICAAGAWFASAFPDMVLADIENNPVLVEHIGVVEDIELDLIATGEVEGGDETFVFNVRGSKGDGVLTAEVVTLPNGDEDVVSGTIRTAAGETYDLFPDAAGPAEAPEDDE